MHPQHPDYYNDYRYSMQQGFPQQPVDYHPLAQEFYTNPGQSVVTEIWVGNLLPTTTRDELRNVFSRFGAVVNTVVHINESKGQGNYGFVTFKNPQSAQAALSQQIVNGWQVNYSTSRRHQTYQEPAPQANYDQVAVYMQQLQGNVPSLDYSSSGLEQAPLQVPQANKIHVSNLPLNITQEELTQVFSRFGTVVDVKIIKKSQQGLPLHTHCYAFVAFDNMDSAEMALLQGSANSWQVKSTIDKKQQPNKAYNIFWKYFQSLCTSKQLKSPQSQTLLLIDSLIQEVFYTYFTTFHPFFNNFVIFYGFKQYIQEDNFIYVLGKDRAPDHDQKRDLKSILMTILPRYKLQLFNRTIIVQYQILLIQDTQSLEDILKHDLKHRRALVPIEQPLEQVEPSREVTQTVTVRELFVTGIPRDKDEQFVRGLFNQFGEIEKVDMYPKNNIYYTYVKFFSIESAYKAYESTNIIQNMFTQPQFIKIYYSDPIKRSYIVGNSVTVENPSHLTNVLFVYFPPHPQLKLDMKFMKEICLRCGCPVIAWKYNQQDPQYKSYLLLEFESNVKSQQMRDFLSKNIQTIIGEDKCEVGILPDDRVYPQNPDHKPTMSTQYSTRQSQFRHSQQQKQVQGYRGDDEQEQGSITPPPSISQFQNVSSSPPQSQQQVYQQSQQQQNYYQPQPFQFPVQSYGILDELALDSAYKKQSMIPQNNYQQQQTYQDNNNSSLIDLLSTFIGNPAPQPPVSQQQYQQQPQQSYQQLQNQSAASTQKYAQNDEHEQYNEFWSGFMLRSRSHRVGVDARSITPNQELPFQLPSNLNVAYRANIDDAIKRARSGIKFILYPSNESDFKEFEEYIKYFNEKSKVGVIQLENGPILYVVPPNKEIEHIHKLKNHELLAIYFDSKQPK